MAAYLVVVVPLDDYTNSSASLCACACCGVLLCVSVLWCVCWGVCVGVCVWGVVVWVCGCGLTVDALKVGACLHLLFN